MAACRPTRELEDWLSGARDMATDAPVIVEKIIQATHDMEQAFKDAGGFPRPRAEAGLYEIFGCLDCPRDFLATETNRRQTETLGDGVIRS